LIVIDHLIGQQSLTRNLEAKERYKIWTTSSNIYVCVGFWQKHLQFRQTYLGEVTQTEILPMQVRLIQGIPKGEVSL